MIQKRRPKSTEAIVLAALIECNSNRRAATKLVGCSYSFTKKIARENGIAVIHQNGKATDPATARTLVKDYEPKPCLRPTDARLESRMRVLVLADRFERGEELYHEDDTEIWEGGL